jgi:hypothetical protein
MPRWLTILLMSGTLLAQAGKGAPRSADPFASPPLPSGVEGALGKRIVEALLALEPELADRLLSGEAEAPGAPSAALTRAVVVERWRWDPMLGRMELRIRCRMRRECLPFLAYVSVRDPRQLTSRGFAVRDGNPPGNVMVKAGEHVLLTVQREGLRISLPVLCLNSARRGEVVRVRHAGNRMLKAVVVGAGHVEPSF